MAEKSIVEETLKAHGLTSRDCLSMAERDGTAILVTRGGQKIAWRPGQPPVQIPDHMRPDAKPEVREKKK